MTSHLWTGAIGLMYVSDYGYSSSGDVATCNDSVMYSWNSGNNSTECAQKSWLFDSNYNQWTLTLRSDFSDVVFRVLISGHVGNCYVDNDNATSPVLYLKSNLKIVCGQGTVDEPYELAQ